MKPIVPHSDYVFTISEPSKLAELNENYHLVMDWLDTTKLDLQLLYRGT